jgi:hypothetical protein
VKAFVEHGLAPRSPVTLSSASASWCDGTATSTASASDASSHASVWGEPGIDAAYEAVRALVLRGLERSERRGHT